jgi:hypothetical protein
VEKKLERWEKLETKHVEKSLCAQDVDKKGTARRYLSTTIQSEVTNVYSLGKTFFLIIPFKADFKLLSIY